MFLFTKPGRERIDEFLDDASHQQYSYPDIGATKGTDPPAGYLHHDHNRILIGRGSDKWNLAKQAIRDWKMFDLGWAGICWPDTEIEEGRTVAMMASHLGIWSLNACRIVYVIDEPSRFGFTYGTLTDHAEAGEERFMVEKAEETEEIFYDLYSFSRPRQILAVLGYPYARYLQTKFIADSKQSMIRAVKNS